MGSEESWLIVNIDNALTKAVLIERTDGGFGVRGSGEAPTTVGPPELDVTVGVRRAAENLASGLGVRLWGAEGPSGGRRLLCSSNTSDGLHMMVAGVISMISTESAERAALGAGALLMDVFSKDDPRPGYQRVDRMRSLRPDMFLLAGGVDGGAEKQVLEMAGQVNAADIKPRFGSEYKLPVIYAGNVEMREEVEGTLSKERYATKLVENVRPVIDRENLGPAREGIYDAYMEHVIVHSPGYEKLSGWVDEPIMPSQAAIGRLLYAYALKRDVNLVAVDVGGATTDVYSVFNGTFNRSLNADIGLTYGIGNIMKTVGVEGIARWVPEEMGEREVRNAVGNMMVAQQESLSEGEASVQQAAAREAMRLGLESHRKIASRLKGVVLKRGISDMFQQAVEDSYLDMIRAKVVIGRGEAFTRHGGDGAAAMLMLDGLEPTGLTELFVDRSSIMPHLGMLCERNREAALQVLSDECLHKLGTCIAPRGAAGEGVEAMRVALTVSGRPKVEETVSLGELKAIPLRPGESARIEAQPRRGLDIGRGNGKRLEAEISGGSLGLIVDARGRPLRAPGKREKLAAWRLALTRATGLSKGSGGN